jgi:hypothetical protein
MNNDWNYYCSLDLASDLIAAGFTEVDFNSNNAWGFGGAVGRRYDRGNVTVKIAEAYVRHQRKPTDFVTVTINGRRVWNEIPSRFAYTKARDLALAA